MTTSGTRFEMDAYAVLTRSLPREEAERVLPFGSTKRELFPDESDANLYHALRISGDADPEAFLAGCRALVVAGQARWLEFGLRGYIIIEGKREYRPWRRNQYMDRAALAALPGLEPEVRYHAPA
jgi:hypothetical protein